jgi:sugar O-acyltransferase (sialic acid O-acetyltransferase NeuD family)
MPTKLLYLIGAGGHGKVVLDALLSSDAPAHDVRVRDEAQQLQGRRLLDYPIEAPAIVAEMSSQLFHLAIGSGQARRRLFATLLDMGARPLSIAHAAASVSRFARIGDGSFMAAQSVVAASASLGHSVIINHGAIVDHDCVVGDFSHIAPNATLGGGVSVGSGVLVGAGAKILPGISIGDDAVIGAGAVVIANVSGGETWVGVPARNTARS